MPLLFIIRLNFKENHMPKNEEWSKSRGLSDTLYF
ncbi:hypothetical protein SAMN05421777_11953 [Fluoribacter gormanii]|uniref:Uncharacterized protein n=1 Tax=Fluoribacter gormanii TaxID=464 RepID=A0A377GGE3_9GAMM|nr:hypothetical protein SAMN05421777_11953 [Fluoribacter gormanii]STO23644.1 Uncharacterised protein [Fluoribacter gormanii]